MVEQIEVFRGVSDEDVASQFNNFMILHDKIVKKVVEIDMFTDYKFHSEDVAIPVDEPLVTHIIRLRYESTLEALTS